MRSVVSKNTAISRRSFAVASNASNKVFAGMALPDIANAFTAGEAGSTSPCRLISHASPAWLIAAWVAATVSTSNGASPSRTSCPSEASTRAAPATLAAISGSTGWLAKRGHKQDAPPLQSRPEGQNPAGTEKSDRAGPVRDDARVTAIRSITVRAIGPMTSKSNRIAGSPSQRGIPRPGVRLQPDDPGMGSRASDRPASIGA